MSFRSSNNIPLKKSIDRWEKSQLELKPVASQKLLWLSPDWLQKDTWFLDYVWEKRDQPSDKHQAMTVCAAFLTSTRLCQTAAAGRIGFDLGTYIHGSRQ